MFRVAPMVVRNQVEETAKRDAITKKWIDGVVADLAPTSNALVSPVSKFQTNITDFISDTGSLSSHQTKLLNSIADPNVKNEINNVFDTLKADLHGIPGLAALQADNLKQALPATAGSYEELTTQLGTILGTQANDKKQLLSVGPDGKDSFDRAVDQINNNNNISNNVKQAAIKEINAIRKETIDRINNFQAEQRKAYEDLKNGAYISKKNAEKLSMGELQELADSPRILKTDSYSDSPSKISQLLMPVNSKEKLGEFAGAYASAVLGGAGDVGLLIRLSKQWRANRLEMGKFELEKTDDGFNIKKFNPKNPDHLHKILSASLANGNTELKFPKFEIEKKNPNDPNAPPERLTADNDKDLHKLAHETVILGKLGGYGDLATPENGYVKNLHRKFDESWVLDPGLLYEKDSNGDFTGVFDDKPLRAHLAKCGISSDKYDALMEKGIHPIEVTIPDFKPTAAEQKQIDKAKLFAEQLEKIAVQRNAAKAGQLAQNAQNVSSAGISISEGAAGSDRTNTDTSRVGFVSR